MCKLCPQDASVVWSQGRSSVFQSDLWSVALGAVMSWFTQAPESRQSHRNPGLQGRVLIHWIHWFMQFQFHLSFLWINTVFVLRRSAEVTTEMSKLLKQQLSINPKNTFHLSPRHPTSPLTLTACLLLQRQKSLPDSYLSRAKPSPNSNTSSYSLTLYFAERTHSFIAMPDTLTKSWEWRESLT